MSCAADDWCRMRYKHLTLRWCRYLDDRDSAIRGLIETAGAKGELFVYVGHGRTSTVIYGGRGHRACVALAAS